MSNRSDNRSKTVIILSLVVVAFFASYGYASSKTRTADAATTYNSGAGTSAALASGGGAGGCCGGGGATGGTGAAAGATSGTGAATSGGGGCCGGGGPDVTKSTTVSGNVQKIKIDTSQGTFNPNVIKAKAGVPIELDFSQAPGGCLTDVVFPDFNITQDLSSGAKTVKLPALQKGQYVFQCQMSMVTGTIVVE